MPILGALAAIVMLATGPASWLDASSPANWNHAGAAVPARPGPRNTDLASGGRCAGEIRAAWSPEDRIVIAHGWTLVGAYHRFGPTVVVMGTSSVDGMCRPIGFQAFVFVNGTFAGTLAPKPMDARTDGSIASLSVTLFGPNDIEADFARYVDADPMCCPHATSAVLYHVTTQAPPRAAPNSVTTTRTTPN